MTLQELKSTTAERMREKYKRGRGWIKIHFAVDVKTKQVTAYEVTDEQIHDNRVQESRRKI